MKEDWRKTVDTPNITPLESKTNSDILLSTDLQEILPIMLSHVAVYAEDSGNERAERLCWGVSLSGPTLEMLLWWAGKAKVTPVSWGLSLTHSLLSVWQRWYLEPDLGPSMPSPARPIPINPAQLPWLKCILNCVHNPAHKHKFSHQPPAFPYRTRMFWHGLHWGVCSTILISLP